MPLLPIALPESTKIVLPYKGQHGDARGEIVVAAKEAGYYRIKSIPFYASRIAPYDLISIHNREGALYFHRIIEGSGYSVVQMDIFISQVKQIGRDIEKFGCIWGLCHKKHRIAFGIPKNVPYSPVENWLATGEEEARWAYRGACLSHL